MKAICKALTMIVVAVCVLSLSGCDCGCKGPDPMAKAKFKRGEEVRVKNTDNIGSIMKAKNTSDGVAYEVRFTSSLGSTRPTLETYYEFELVDMSVKTDTELKLTEYEAVEGLSEKYAAEAKAAVGDAAQEELRQKIKADIESLKTVEQRRKELLRLKAEIHAKNAQYIALWEEEMQAKQRAENIVASNSSPENTGSETE